MVLFRKSAFAVSLKSPRLIPRSFTAPALGLSSPDRIFNKVVLPDPDGPKTATPSPVFTEKEMSFNISRLRSPSQYTLLTASASILVSLLLIPQCLHRIKLACHDSGIKRR